MNNKYIVNDKVEFSKIAMDIKYRKITKDDIEKICSNQQIKSAFFGDECEFRCPKTEWNKEYLDRLSYAVETEKFNKDYLLYLDEVADFVSKSTFKKVKIKGIVFVVVLIAGVVVLTYILKGGNL